jgi:hypothetical protein
MHKSMYVYVNVWENDALYVYVNVFENDAQIYAHDVCVCKFMYAYTYACINKLARMYVWLVLWLFVCRSYTQLELFILLIPYSVYTSERSQIYMVYFVTVLWFICNCIYMVYL